MPVFLPPLYRGIQKDRLRPSVTATDNYDSGVTSKFKKKLHDITPERLPRAIYKILRCEFSSDDWDSDSTTDTLSTSEFGTFSLRSWVFGEG